MYRTHPLESNGLHLGGCFPFASNQQKPVVIALLVLETIGLVMAGLGAVGSLSHFCQNEYSIACMVAGGSSALFCLTLGMTAARIFVHRPSRNTQQSNEEEESNSIPEGFAQQIVGFSSGAHDYLLRATNSTGETPATQVTKEEECIKTVSEETEVVDAIACLSERHPLLIDAMIGEIFKYCSLQDCVRLQGVCKAWRPVLSKFVPLPLGELKSITDRMDADQYRRFTRFPDLDLLGVRYFSQQKKMVFVCSELVYIKNFDSQDAIIQNSKVHSFELLPFIHPTFFAYHRRRVSQPLATLPSTIYRRSIENDRFDTLEQPGRYQMYFVVDEDSHVVVDNHALSYWKGQIQLTFTRSTQSNKIKYGAKLTPYADNVSKIEGKNDRLLVVAHHINGYNTLFVYVPVESTNSLDLLLTIDKMTLAVLDGDTVIFINEEQKLIKHDFKTGKASQSVDCDSDLNTFLCEDYLVTASKSGKILIWNKETLSIKYEWQLLEEHVAKARQLIGYLYEVCALLLREKVHSFFLTGP